MISNRENHGSSSEDEWLEALPGLARIASGAAWHGAAWAAERSRRLGGRVVRAAASPREAIALADDTRVFTVEALRLMAALLELGSAPSSAEHSRAAEEHAAGWSDTSGPGLPRSGRDAQHEPSTPGSDPPEGASFPGGEASLRQRGQELLERSRDVNYHDDAHPAFARILDELAPDEARMLLLLLLHGPQPAIDVRTGGPVGLVKSKLVAPGLNMIGPRAGLRHLDRVSAYLNNLFRLGLIWFSHETLPDTSRYQLLEAQPDVLSAVKSVSHARVVRRSIHLTPFGEDFCTTCLAPAATRLEELPEHSIPQSPPAGSEET